MRIEQLRYLVDIAETRSISATAQRMYINQQALSKSMKQLEQELGTQLLVRTNRGVHLSKSGEDILEYARQMIALEENMKYSCEYDREKTEASTEIGICSASSVTNIVLPDIVAKYNAMQKDISLKIDTTNNITSLFQQVQDGVYDIGLLTYNAKAFQREFASWQQELDVNELAQDELLIVTEKKYLKDGLDYFPLDEFFRHVRTLYNVMTTDEAKDLSAQSTMTSSGDADFHRRMIEQAGAVVTMSGMAYRYFFSAKKYIGLPMEGHSVPLIHAAVYRKDAEEEIKKFIAMIRRELYIK